MTIKSSAGEIKMSNTPKFERLSPDELNDFVRAVNRVPRADGLSGYTHKFIERLRVTLREELGWKQLDKVSAEEAQAVVAIAERMREALPEGTKSHPDGDVALRKSCGGIYAHINGKTFGVSGMSLVWALLQVIEPEDEVWETLEAIRRSRIEGAANER